MFKKDKRRYCGAWRSITPGIPSIKVDHMLFDDVLNSAKWQKRDNFPSSIELKTEINEWLMFIQKKNQLERYLPRLNDSKTILNEALAEIFSAYLLENVLKYSVIDWERETVDNKNVDFIIQDGSDEIYCEVKSPGWEGELEQEERLSGRKDLPKYINAEFRHVGPWRAVRHAIKKAYPKFLPRCKNLVILKDDLFLSLFDEPTQMNKALFEDKPVYDNEVGYFVDNRFNNIGGILFVNYIKYALAPNITYLYEFCSNNNSNSTFKIKKR